MIRGNKNGFGNDSHCTFFVDGSEIIGFSGTDITTELARGGSSHTGTLNGTIIPGKTSLFLKYGRYSWQFSPDTNDSYMQFPVKGGGPGEDWSFASDIYAIGMWIAFPTFTYTANFVHTIYGSFQNSSNYKGLIFSIDNGATTTKVQFVIKESGVDTIFMETANIKTLEDTFFHIAVLKNGTNYLLFLNGIEVDSDIGVLVSKTDLPLIIGDISTTLNIAAAAGFDRFWIDEIRRSKDVVRWGSDFTVPNRAY